MMKLALDHKRLHLRLFFGIGFAVFIIKKIIKKNNGSSQNLKSVGKEMKRLLKDYKRKKGALNLIEIESDGTKILIRL